MPTKAEKEGWRPPGTCLPATGKEFPPVDISRINVAEIAKSLSAELNKPAPRTWLGTWFRNRRMELDQRRIDAICSYMESLRTINTKAVAVQAELFVAPAALEVFIQGNLQSVKHELELQLAEHQERIQEINDRADARRLQLKMLDVKVDALAAEVHNVRSKTLINETVSDKIREIQMSGAELANVITSLGGKTEINEDLATLNQKIEMLNAEIMIKRAEGDLKSAVAERERIQARKDDFAEKISREEYRK